MATDGDPVGPMRAALAGAPAGPFGWLKGCPGPPAVFRSTRCSRARQVSLLAVTVVAALVVAPSPNGCA